MAQCISDEQLRKLADGILSEDDASDLEAHLHICGRCARRIARLSGGDDLITELRSMQTAHDAMASSLDRLSETEKAISTTLFDGR